MNTISKQKVSVAIISGSPISTDSLPGVIQFDSVGNVLYVSRGSGEWSSFSVDNSILRKEITSTGEINIQGSADVESILNYLHTATGEVSLGGSAITEVGE